MNAHGTSTLMNDRSECAAMRAVFGRRVGTRRGQLHQERDGPPDRRRRRGRGRRLRAGDPSRRRCRSTRTSDEPDPECDLDIVRDEPRRAARARWRCPTRSASAAPTAASPSATPRKSTARLGRPAPDGGAARTDHRQRRRSAARASPADDLGRARGRPLRDRADRAVGRRRWPAQLGGRGRATTTRRALTGDRKLHKLIRRTDLFGLYAADRRSTAPASLAHRDTLDERPPATFNDRSGVYVGSGGGAYRTSTTTSRC